MGAHMRAVQENIRKHHCEYCEFTSFASSALKRHILAIHEKRKPFECDKCSFKSSYKESLELHLANKHKDEGVPEHLQIKAIRKKTRKSDRVETMVYETTLQPEYVTHEFVVTADATEEAIAAQSIAVDQDGQTIAMEGQTIAVEGQTIAVEGVEVQEAMEAEEITTEIIAAEAISL